MGEILIALDEQLERQVAIKLMHADQEASHRFERFEREARLIAKLQHPNIVQVYDYGVDEQGTPYIVMELLDGEDLSQLLTRAGTMPLAAVVPWVVQTARGLHAAHRVGIIHRDLKPANLFLSRQGSEQTLKILDFGIATAPKTDVTAGPGKRSQLLGTPSYMSPEQARARKVDHRTDLWSLAIVAYQALTGVSPFVGRNVVHTVMRIVDDPLVPPSQLVESLGPNVDAFFARALDKDIEQRFSSALDFAAAFSALERSGEQRPAVILVVDDEPDVELLLTQRFRRMVRRKEYELLFARDGGAALDVLALRPDVDVVLTDLNMPGMDGLTLLQRLGRAGPALRAVVLSAYDDMAHIRAAMNAGAYDFLTKPLDFQDLRATLAKAVRDARELRRALRSIEENDALRLVVDDALKDRLLPMLRISGEVSGDTIDGTVVSIDVAGMRETIERGPPTAVFERLNRTFDRVVPLMTSAQGLLVSFVGDAALFIFEGDDHLSRAAMACLDVLAAASDGADPAGHRVCVGLDTGPVVSGNIGSKQIQRLNYTVLGEIVSHARQLEHLAEAGQLLVRQHSAIQLAHDFECYRVDRAPDPTLGTLYTIQSKRSDDAKATGESSTRALAATAILDEPE